MSSFSKKIVALFLNSLLFFQIISSLFGQAFAVESSMDFRPAKVNGDNVNIGFLGAGLNFLAVNGEFVDNAYSLKTLLKDKEGLYYRYISVKQSSQFEIEAKNAETYAAKLNVSASYSSEAKLLSFLQFKNSYSAKAGLDFSGSTSSYFRTTGLKYRSGEWLLSEKCGESITESALKKRLWNNLDDECKAYLCGYDAQGNSYSCVKTPQDPKGIGWLFEKIGTHIIIGYRDGAQLSVHESAVSTSSSENLSASLDTQFDAKVGIDQVGAGAAFSTNIEAETKKSSDDSYFLRKVVQFGGKCDYDGNGKITKWNPDESSLCFFIDDTLRYIPLWELLPEQYAVRAAELQEYFYQRAEEVGLDFFKYTAPK